MNQAVSSTANGYTVVIVDCTEQIYNGATITAKPTGGIPLVVTHLAEHLAKAGCHITVHNRTPEPMNIKNVTWVHHDDVTPSTADFIIACNDVKIFDQPPYAEMIAGGAIPILWVHNLFTWKRVWKKKRFGSLWRHKPATVFLGDYQFQQCSKFMPLGLRRIIAHGVGDLFFDVPQSPTPRKPQALFLSKAFRGFGDVLKLWMNDIHPVCPQAVLKAYIGREEIKNFKYTESELLNAGVHILDRAPQSVLIEDMVTSSCLIYPGHKDETFCNVAAESTVLGLPVITKGIGALAERAATGGGICAANDHDMVKSITACLLDSAYAQGQSQKALAVRDQYRWDHKIKDWLQLFRDLKR